MAAIPDAALGFLLQNLREFVTWNADLIAGAAGKAVALIQELEVLKAFLDECRKAYNDDVFLDKLAKDVRKLVYRAEDAIETYIATAFRQKSRDAFRRALYAIDYAAELRNLDKELGSIIAEVQKINIAKVDLGPVVKQSDYPRGHEQSLTKLSVHDDMVGFEDAMEDVVGLITEGPENLEIVSIVGMFGLGKSTLARKVINHPTVEYHFFTRAFVEVSAEYTAKEVFLKILRCFTSVTREMNNMSSDYLAQEITNYLEKRIFLIVLDDIWTVEAWDDLKRALPNNQKHSRVLITTRHKSVAQYARQGLEPYDLRFLRDYESRELLRKRVFGENLLPHDLEQLEQDILGRCDGLPLAIVVTAGILLNHRNGVSWWSKVAKDLDTYLATQQQVSYVINSSFNNLPYYLKACFLYLGVFHPGFEIPSKTLLQLWVSEGFVLPVNGGKGLEDIAEDHLEELAARNLVMVDKKRLDGRIKTIRIQNTLREFCKSQAIKEALFREIRGFEHGDNISPYDDRRLCINSNILEYIKSEPSGKYVRSFLSFAKEDCILPAECSSVIPKAFRLVRVLDIRSIILTQFPDELYYLFLLKYVAMSSNFNIIPGKMSNLRYLQTFIIKTTQHALEIRADIWKLAHLRHLETNASTSLVKTKAAFSFNKNLQTLSKISPESCSREVFARAPQLKKLGIHGKLDSSLEALFNTFSDLGSLENLKLLIDDVADDVAGGLHSLPSESIFPANLTRLTLQNTKLDWGCISTLGKLKKLEVLKLRDNAFMGPHWEAEKYGFSVLKVLHIAHINLATWNASASCFPSLTQLDLKHCSELKAIPSDLVNISGLQLIHIYCCNVSVCSSAVKLVSHKRQVQAQDKDDKSSTLKLSIYPPYA